MQISGMVKRQIDCSRFYKDTPMGVLMSHWVQTEDIVAFQQELVSAS